MVKTNEQIAMQVSKNTIITNVILTIFKLFAGVFAHSAAMLSDAIHTLSDVLSTIIVIAGVKLANQKSDKEHPYGHERMECVAAIILSAMLFATGTGIGYTGVRKIINANEFIVPGTLALIAAITSIVTKEAMYWYTRLTANKIDSSILMADAWHHRSDALSSIGSFIGILGARLGFPILDPLSCVIICLFITKAAFSIFMDSIDKMTDKACDDKIISDIHDLILAQKDVIRIDQLKTRLFGDKIYVDIEISLDGNATLYETHTIAHKVRDSIETQFPKVKHCMVHVNPM